MTHEQKKCCDKCRHERLEYGAVTEVYCTRPTCKCHTPTLSSLIEQEKEIYAKWKAEHGDVSHENNPTSAEWYVRNYVDTRLLPHITTLLHTEREKLMMEYLLAFGNYVPLGGGDVEPEIMAKEVCEMMKEVGRAEERERVVKMCEEMKATTNDIEPKGGWCKEFADGWDSAISSLLEKQIELIEEARFAYSMDEKEKGNSFLKLLETTLKI